MLLPTVLLCSQGRRPSIVPLRGFAETSDEKSLLSLEALTRGDMESGFPGVCELQTQPKTLLAPGRALGP